MSASSPELRLVDAISYGSEGLAPTDSSHCPYSRATDGSPTCCIMGSGGGCCSGLLGSVRVGPRSFLVDCIESDESMLATLGVQKRRRR